MSAKQENLTETAMQNLWRERLGVCRCDQCVSFARRVLGEAWTAKAVQELRDAIMPVVRKKTT